ncbi:hypothetical protein FRB95_003526 [Tulasnella sp. JGI-2019a]|nr:hypothetical protein FRB95_003526 [Tulasnella sp. JGI-2019a]
MISDKAVTNATTNLLKDGGSDDHIRACNGPTGADKICYNAWNFCVIVTYTTFGQRDPTDPLPQSWYIDYLRQESVQKAIGAKAKY